MGLVSSCKDKLQHFRIKELKDVLTQLRISKQGKKQILNMIPKEQDGEDAPSCVCCCIGGGSATENADSYSDLEVVADSFIINLRCPSQCPICLKNNSLELVIIDPYFNITTMDPSIQTLLPTRSSDPSAHAHLRNQQDISNDDHMED